MAFKITEEKRVKKGSLQSSATQFIFNIVGNYIEIPNKTNQSIVKKCWLCGQSTTNYFSLRDGISKTFCLSDQSHFPNSNIVCMACHAMSSKKYFDKYAEVRPEMGLKPGYATSWRNYSHVAFKEHHSCPKRSEWSDWLLSPPEPPFLFVIAVSSQKHLIYKSKISTSRELFFVQMEDELLTVERDIFKGCFEIVKALVELGFSKKQILTNNYIYKLIMKYGKEKWKKLNDDLLFYRKLHSELIELACFCVLVKKQET